MSTRVRRRSRARGACASRVVTSLEGLVMVVAGAYLAVALLAGIRYLGRGDALYMACFGVVLGVMAVVCVGWVRVVRPGVYVDGAVGGAGVVLVAAGLLALGWPYLETGTVVLLAVLGVVTASRRHRRRRPASPPSPTAPLLDPGPDRPGPEPVTVVRVEPGAVDIGIDIGIDISIDDTMTDLDLCRAWRSSYVGLERAGTAASRVRIVRARSVLLDELERRHPAAVRAWLESGARAASGPERHVLGPRRGGIGDHVG